MIPEHGPLTFQIEARNDIDNELNVPRGKFYYAVQVSYLKAGEKMLMINPKTGWSGFSFKDHDALMAFVSHCTVIHGIPMCPT